MHEILARLLPHVEDDMRRKLDEKFGPGPTNQSLTDQPTNEPRINRTTPAGCTVQTLFLLFYDLEFTTCPNGQPSIPSCDQPVVTQSLISHKHSG